MVRAKRKISEDIKGFNNFVKLMHGDPLTTIKRRKKRAKELVPRKQPERELREALIKELRRKGCIVKRIENAITGRNKSVPDLIVFNPIKKIGGFMELKSEKGQLSKGKHSQEDFRDLCIICNINHWVVRSIDEAKKYLNIYHVSLTTNQGDNYDNQ